MAAPQWIDVSNLPFDVLLLLEEPHLRWFPRTWPQNELGVALKHNEPVHDYFRMRLRGDEAWLSELVSRAEDADPETVRRCEIAVMKEVCDWIVYVHCPQEYDKQPFLRWDDAELLCLTDYRGKVIADIGSGTGRLLEPVVAAAETVYAVDPIANLRKFLKAKFSEYKAKFFALDGLITDIPLPRGTCDVVLAGHVFGDAPDREIEEMERVAKPGGMVILCPGNSDADNEAHRILVTRGYQWSVLREPVDGPKRKYWATV